MLGSRPTPSVPLLTMLAFTFLGGLALGLLLHLPAVSSPHPRRAPAPPPNIAHQPPPPISRTDLKNPTRIKLGDYVSGGASKPDQGIVVTGERLQQKAVSPELAASHSSLAKQQQQQQQQQHLELSAETLPEADSAHARPYHSQHSNNNSAARSSVSVKLSDNKRTRDDDPAPSKGGKSRSLTDLVRGVYWTPEAEALAPLGFPPTQLDSWRQRVTGSRVVGMEEGCGRMQNRMLTFADGTRACARYRINNDQILGDVLSYHLSHLLGIRQVPPSVLALPDTRTPTWQEVAGPAAAAQWHPERPVVLVPWVDNLRPAFIPRELRTIPRRLHPTPALLVNRTSDDDLRELLQWSDLIVFDFITANLDRVVNNMFNEQWNSDSMAGPAHNLEATGDGLLVFLDNEAGLFHGYRLLDKYGHFHADLLQGLCIFRPETAARVRALFAGPRGLGRELTAAYTSREPLHPLLPSLPPANVHTLQDRLRQVYEQIEHCEHLYPS